ncbi:FadR/GntR family transcriptional regulator [Microbacterium halotolerans]|uniref:FadR/GntR family transcriptional regulator n=1 Tax=Microbacterium halotolerans TaxID=246613 RepID=UPI000E6AC4CE|nr:FCD domain-containing protein [Microbacterium halotolerans]
MAETPKAWRIVLDRIEADLFSGRLGPGDRLPGERELASTMSVGRSSVREALRVLEVMGVVRTAVGSGPSSGAMIVSTPAGGLGSLLRLQTAAQAFEFSDIVATRLVLEGAVVRELAGRDEPDLSAAQALLDAMSTQDLTREEFLVLDQNFHHALAEASGNAVIATVMAGLRSAIEAYVTAGAATIADWETTAARLRAEHAGVLDAIRNSVPDEAARLVNDHITGYYAQMRDEA